MTTLLAVHHLSAGYGPVQVLTDLELSVEAGEIVVVLGASVAPAHGFQMWTFPLRTPP